MDNQEKIQPELEDFIENIQRYIAINKNNVCFVASFVAFKKDPKQKCVECNEPLDVIDDSASSTFIYGDKYTLRILLEDLRDKVEDFSDENGFVNI